MAVTRGSSVREVHAFPSEMTVLLALLAVAVGLGAAFVAAWLTGLAHPCPLLEADQCGVLSGESVMTFLDYVIMLVAPGFLGFQIYARLRRRGTTPLAAAPFTEAAGAIERLVRESGVTGDPELLFGPKLGNRSFVGGSRRKCYLVVGPELLALYGKGEQSRRRFTAVLAHEIAHLSNHDLRSYFLATVLRACNLSAAAWVTFGLVLSLGAQDIATGVAVAELVRIALLVVLIELLVRAFLRTREYYADLRAERHEPGGLRDAVGGATGTVVSGWRLWLRRHPSHARRLAALREPGWLLASSPGHLFLGASFAGVALLTLQDQLLRLFRGTSNPLTTVVLTALLVGLPLTAFVAVGVWRQTWHAAWLGRRPRTAASAGALAAGLLLGTYLAPFNRITGDTATSGIPLSISTLLVVPVSAAVLCYWLAAVGATWCRRDPDAHAIGRLLRYALPAAGVVGGWILTLAWMWTVTLLSLHYGCQSPQGAALTICTSAGQDADVAAAMGARFGGHPSTYVALAVATASLLTPRYLLRPRSQARYDGFP